jgi:hypothetical protein
MRVLTVSMGKRETSTAKPAKAPAVAAIGSINIDDYCTITTVNRKMEFESCLKKLVRTETSKISEIPVKSVRYVNTSGLGNKFRRPCCQKHGPPLLR